MLVAPISNPLYSVTRFVSGSA